MDIVWVLLCVTHKCPSIYRFLNSKRVTPTYWHTYCYSYHPSTQQICDSTINISKYSKLFITIVIKVMPSISYALIVDVNISYSRQSLVIVTMKVVSKF